MAINQIQADNELTATELEEYNYYVGMAQALDRLERNPDFQKVILEGYFKDRAINGVSILANPGVKRRGERPDIMEQLVAISQLQDYFITLKNLGAEMPDEEFEDGDDGIEE